MPDEVASGVQGTASAGSRDRQRNGGGLMAKAQWHRNKQSGGAYEHVLFVGVWEWRIRSVGASVFIPVAVRLGFGLQRWWASGPGLEGGRPTASSTVFTETLPQAKQRCEDAALRVVEAAAADLGMKVVPQ